MIRLAGAEMMKKKGVDCLTIFLKPPSIKEFEDRLRTWLTYDDEVVKNVESFAEEDMQRAADSKMFDLVLPNKDLNASYYELMQLIHK